MKVILNAPDGASRADLIEMACTAHFALATGIESQPPGYTMAVARGDDYRRVFGVVRRKGCLSVYPPHTEKTDG